MISKDIVIYDFYMFFELIVSKKKLSICMISFIHWKHSLTHLIWELLTYIVKGVCVYGPVGSLIIDLNLWL